MAAALDRWLALEPSPCEVQRTIFEQQWREFQRMGAELERVSVVDWEPSDT